MANMYVYSGAAGTATGADWTNAKLTLAAGATASAVGDDIWVASDHAETAAAATTIIFPGTTASPNRCMSVNRAGSVPPVAADLTAGASVTTTGAFSITFGGSAYIYGITANCGTGANSATLTVGNSSNSWQMYDTCALNLIATTGANRIVINAQSSAGVELNNTTISFGSVSQSISHSLGGRFEWRNKSGSVAITGATLPNTLMSTASTIIGRILFSGLDLSSLGSGKNIAGTNGTRFEIVNCKLDPSVTVASTPGQASSLGIRLLGSHSTTNVQRNEIYHYAGTLTTETTIKRTGGASDGTNSYSWKIITTANAKRQVSFESFEGVIWNTSLTAKTLTVHCVTDNVTLTDAEAWVEVDYLGSSATPISTNITDANATLLSTAANQTTSTETWTTTGLTTPVKQQFNVTFTPAMIGLIRWRVRVAKASTTVYVCPKAELS